MSQNINYQHLFYFWNVVKEDSFTKASKKLGLAQPTISGQISTFEKSLGAILLNRQGRRINLTETGQIVYNYAEKIFKLGEQMNEDIKSSNLIYQHTLVAGFRNSIPNQIISKLTQYLIEGTPSYKLVFFNDNNEMLLRGVAQKNLDFAVTDEPLSYYNGLPLYAQLLLQSDISIFANSDYLGNSSNQISYLLQSQFSLLPSQNTRIRAIVDEFFLIEKIKPKILAEIENYDILMAMAKNTPYMLVAPSIIKSKVKAEIDFHEIFRIPKYSVNYYAVTHSENPEKNLLTSCFNKLRSSATNYSTRDLPLRNSARSD